MQPHRKRRAGARRPGVGAASGSEPLKEELDWIPYLGSGWLGGGQPQLGFHGCDLLPDQRRGNSVMLVNRCNGSINKILRRTTTGIPQLYLSEKHSCVLVV